MHLPAHHSTHPTAYRFGVALSLLLAALLSSCAARTPAPSKTPTPPTAAQPTPSVQLGTTVVPRKYTLELGIVPTLERFNGRTTIEVSLDMPTAKVKLHGRGLEVSEAVAILPSGEERSGRYRQLNDDGLAVIAFDAELPAGAATLRITYTAPFGKQLRGLYRVQAEGADYAFTQFEATSARAAFPCFDEPRFKTPFEVWLTVAGEDVAVGNTLVENEAALADGYRRLQFAPTQPLPTYLIAFAVGPFDVVQAPPLAPNTVRSRPVPFRGIAPKGKGALLSHALSETPGMVAALEDYFAVPYPFDKLDIIAVPDFAAGAMENAGAITFRDWLLLMDDRTAVEKQRRGFAYVMAHELAHQWFGNYVTMPWWNDIWLNEAFATWMGHRVVAELYPDYHAGSAFLGYVHRAMDADSLLSARMIRQPVHSYDDITNAFDGITYSKGGGVLAMFERYLGATRFRDGIRRYMNEHAFGNATATDLIDALAGDDGPLKRAFGTFLEQSGVPLVTAALQCEADAPPKLALSQTRFLRIGSERPDDRRWSIPVCVRYGLGDGTGETCSLLEEAQHTLDLPLPACPTWMMPNADAAGYYLWALPPEGLAALRAHFATLTLRERLSLARNLVAGLDGGSMAARDVLSALPTLVQGDEREVLEAPMGVLSVVSDHLVSESVRPKVAAYARQLYQPLYRKLGARPGRKEDGERKLLRASVMATLADMGRDPAVRATAAKLGRAYLGGKDGALAPGAVPADLAPLAVRIAIEDGDDATFDRALSAFRAAGDPLTRGVLLRALSSVRDGRSARALSLSLDPELRVNEVLVPVATQLSDARTREAAWQWFTENYDAIQDRVSARNMGHTPWMASGFCSEAHAERLQAFYEPRLEGLSGGPRALAGAVEALKLCAARRAAQGPSAEAFFEARP